MPRFLPSAMITVLFGLFASFANAQTPAATPPAPGAPAPAASAPSTPPKLDKVEAHIKTLHAKLAITPEQQAKFDAFAEAMRDQDAAMYAAREKQVDSTLSAPEEMQRYADMAQTHADAVKQMLTPFKALYDSLSDAQKKKADALFAHPHKAAAHVAESPESH